jgi:hypothetical protein
MKRQIASISIGQTSKVVALVYGACMVIFIPIGLIALFTGAKARPAALLLICAPLIYGVVAYIGTAVACWIYNEIAKRVGGIEFNVSPAERVESVTTDPAPLQ